MIAVLSPAKTLDYDTEVPVETHSEPEFLEESKELVDILNDYDVDDLESLMSISEKLAVLNHDRYQSFETPFTPDNSRQAIFAFKGDVYRDLELDAYEQDEFDYMQRHVRILSGLYGILRPLDLMQPYRLEMGTKLKNPRGSKLYDFWGSKIGKSLNSALNEQGDSILVNLASNEYFKSIDTDALDAEIVGVDFLDEKKGEYKIISFYAKRARGWMTNYMVRNHCESVDDLKGFDVDGYYFSEERSDPGNLVFLRDEA